MAPPPRSRRLPSPPRRPKVSRAPLRPAGPPRRGDPRRHRRIRRLCRGARWTTPVDPVPHRECRASRSARRRRAGDRPRGRHRTGRDGRRSVGDRPPEPGGRTELGVAGCRHGRIRRRWGWGTDRCLGRNRKVPGGGWGGSGGGIRREGRGGSGPGEEPEPLEGWGPREPVGSRGPRVVGRSVPRGGRPAHRPAGSVRPGRSRGVTGPTAIERWFGSSGCSAAESETATSVVDPIRCQRKVTVRGIGDGDCDDESGDDSRWVSRSAGRAGFLVPRAHGGVRAGRSPMAILLPLVTAAVFPVPQWGDRWSSRAACSRRCRRACGSSVAA